MKLFNILSNWIWGIGFILALFFTIYSFTKKTNVFSTIAAIFLLIIFVFFMLPFTFLPFDRVLNDSQAVYFLALVYFIGFTSSIIGFIKAKK